MPLRLRSEIPEFNGVTEWVNGEISKDDLKGKPVLVHFWSVSCGICKKTLPDINEWREKYKPYNLQLIGVHMPRSEKDTEIQPVKDTIEKYELIHPQMIDNQHSVVDAFQNEYVPAYYLFDAEGKLRHYQAGEKGLQMVEQRLKRVLNIKE